MCFGIPDSDRTTLNGSVDWIVAGIIQPEPTRSSAAFLAHLSVTRRDGGYANESDRGDIDYIKSLLAFLLGAVPCYFAGLSVVGWSILGGLLSRSLL